MGLKKELVLNLKHLTLLFYRSVKRDSEKEHLEQLRFMF